MRIQLVAVGRAKPGPARELFESYVERLKTSPWGRISLKEVEVRRKLTGEELKVREGELILDAVGRDAYLVALDEKGRQHTSQGFARLLAGHMDAATAQLAFVIGGAEGLSEAVLARARQRLAFGSQTWPHMLVRVLLAEQLYRAHSILSGHPYHRE